MLKGTWHLNYLDDNTSGMTEDDFICCTVALKATTEDLAVREALTKYHAISAKSCRGGDLRRYPREPTLTFDVDPSEWLTKTFILEIEKET